MSYPKTPEQRLLQLYGYTHEDLLRLFIECERDKSKYMEKLEKLDNHHATKCYTEMMDERTFVH